MMLVADISLIRIDKLSGQYLEWEIIRGLERVCKVEQGVAWIKSGQQS